VALARQRRGRSLTPLPFGYAGFGMVYREGETDTYRNRPQKMPLLSLLLILAQRPTDYSNLRSHDWAHKDRYS